MILSENQFTENSQPSNPGIRSPYNRMPVVSPALTRQISIKVREEMIFEDKADNWRSIINLHPIDINQATEGHKYFKQISSGNDMMHESSEMTSSFGSDLESEENY